MTRALLVCGFFAGCAPAAELRPAAPLLPNRTFEAGVGGATVGPRKYVTESWTETGVAWFTGRVSRTVTLSAIGAYDSSQVTGGGAVRITPFQYNRFAAGAEAQIGYGWGALLVPLAVRLFDETWIYTSPRFGTINRYLSYSIPAGVSARIWDGLMVRGEVQVSWEDFQYYNRRWHFALGVAYQF